MKYEVLLSSSFKSICRTCLMHGELFKIHEVCWEGIHLKDIIMNWIPNIEYQEDDSLPQQLCKSCIKATYRIYHFLYKCKYSESCLKQVLLKETTNIAKDKHDCSIKNSMFIDNIEQSNCISVSNSCDEPHIVYENKSFIIKREDDMEIEDLIDIESKIIDPGDVAEAIKPESELFDEVTNIEEQLLTMVSDDNELVSNRDGSVKADGENTQFSNGSYAEENVKEQTSDYHSSNSKYVSSDSLNISNFFDSNDLCTPEELSPKTPLEITPSEDEMEMALNVPSEGEMINKTSRSKKGQDHYRKSKSARERPTICPICFDDVVTHFPRHLIRHHADHEDVKLLTTLKPGSKERLRMVTVLRKRGNFHLKIKKGVLHPVRNSVRSETEYYTCTYCLGHYSKKLLHQHVKKCENKPTDLKYPGQKCLSKSQTFMVSAKLKNQDFLETSRVKSEVFNIMRPDNISFVAKSDPLICLYGEKLLNKHKSHKISVVVSNKIREMARLLISMKSFDSQVSGLFDLLKPDRFQDLISATKIISNYNIETKSFKSPSLALHMGTNLKTVCDVAYNIVLQNRSIPNIKWNNKVKTKQNIKELQELIVSHWCNEISSLALKDLKKKQWESFTRTRKLNRKT